MEGSTGLSIQVSGLALMCRLLSGWEGSWRPIDGRLVLRELGFNHPSKGCPDEAFSAAVCPEGFSL